MSDGKVLAAARDAWQASDEGRMLASDINGPVGGNYLRNRLEIAFCAGYEAAQPPAVGVDVSEEIREWIGYLVSMAAITDEEMARHYAEKIDAALRNGDVAADQEKVWLCGFCRRNYTIGDYCCEAQSVYRTAALRTGGGE